MYVLFVTHCSIQDHSQIYRVGDMFKVLVVQCDIQLLACFSIFEVESACFFFQDLYESDSFHSTRQDYVGLQ